MKFKLENFRIIKEALIDLKGITIIAGTNNTGKSTISKALYTTVKVNNVGRKYILKQLVDDLIDNL